MGSGITAVGSGITIHWIRVSRFLRDQGSRCTIFVESGSNICHAVGIKDQTFGYKNGISDEKAYLVTALTYYFMQHCLTVYYMTCLSPQIYNWDIQLYVPTLPLKCWLALEISKQNYNKQHSGKRGVLQQEYKLQEVSQLLFGTVGFFKKHLNL